MGTFIRVLPVQRRAPLQNFAPNIARARVGVLHFWSDTRAHHGLLRTKFLRNTPARYGVLGWPATVTRNVELVIARVSLAALGLYPASGAANFMAA
jgi:hypothetical protein